MTDEQQKILELVDEIDADEVRYMCQRSVYVAQADMWLVQTETLDAAAVKRQILRFEKAINKNQEMRVKFPDSPEKFMDSEADLDEEIKKLLALTQAPQHYRELVNLNTIPSLLSLLSHENTDISLDAIELINELIDEDVAPNAAADGDGEDDDIGEAIEESIEMFVEALVRMPVSRTGLQ